MAEVSAVLGDVTLQGTPVVVNAANTTLLGGGGVDGAIHRAAGPALLAACRALPELRPGVRCPTGAVRVTPGFELCRYIVHAPGPIFSREPDPSAALATTWRSICAAMDRTGEALVAAPAVSCGVYGYPHDLASRVAVSVVRTWPATWTMRFVLFLPREHAIWEAAVQRG